MKKIIVLVLLGLHSYFATSQQIYAVFVGDTIVLSVPDVSSSVIWQQSSDSINWFSIAGSGNNYEYIVSDSILESLFFRAATSNNDLCSNNIITSSILHCRIINDTSQIQIGDLCFGGIVFYIDSIGNGLITPQEDLVSVPWGCYGVSVSGATSFSDGLSNTEAISISCQEYPIAARVCDTLNLNGYDDWFLPAFDQLNKLYEHKDIIGSYSDWSYWSSTEYDSISAYITYFTSGSNDVYNKSFGSVVRCIRTF